jgi:hypothetical protein
MITTIPTKDEQLSNIDKQVFKLNFSKTVIYRIYCKDTKITDCYIGRTTSFNSRKSGHKLSSKRSELKVYKKIRECGGWNNWIMDILNVFNCKNKYEAAMREQQYINFFKPNLNSISAYSKGYVNCIVDINNVENESKVDCYSYIYNKIDNIEFLEEDEIIYEKKLEKLQYKLETFTHPNTQRMKDIVIQMRQLLSLKAEIKAIVAGKKTQFLSDFIKDVCAKTT